MIVSDLLRAFGDIAPSAAHRRFPSPLLQVCEQWAVGEASFVAQCTRRRARAAPHGGPMLTTDFASAPARGNGGNSGRPRTSEFGFGFRLPGALASAGVWLACYGRSAAHHVLAGRMVCMSTELDDKSLQGPGARCPARAGLATTNTAQHDFDFLRGAGHEASARVACERSSSRCLRVWRDVWAELW